MDVLVVDDHPIIHQTLGAVISSVVPHARIHSEEHLAGALSRARELSALELVLLDLGLPGCSGIDALVRLRKALPGVRIAVISASEDAESIRGALAAGAVGYVPKTSRPAAIADALRLMLDGGLYIPAQASEHLLPARKAATLADLGLTGRQADVMRLVARGFSNSEIARRLHIAENTVKQHAHGAYRALGVTSRTEALVLLARFRVSSD